MGLRIAASSTAPISISASATASSISRTITARWRSLVQQRVFNPETKRPWSEEDATVKWEQVQKEATDDRANCALVASLPELQTKLDDLQKQAAAQPSK